MRLILEILRYVLQILLYSLKSQMGIRKLVGGHWIIHRPWWVTTGLPLSHKLHDFGCIPATHRGMDIMPPLHLSNCHMKVKKPAITSHCCQFPLASNIDGVYHGPHGFCWRACHHIGLGLELFYGGGHLQPCGVDGSFNLFMAQCHRGCLNNPIFSNLGLCTSCVITNCGQHQLFIPSPFSIAL